MSRNRSSRRQRALENELASDHMIDELNIRRRVCRVFQEDPERTKKSENKNERICVCGHPEKKHKHAVETLVTKWSIANNTFERIDPKYGPIREGALCIQLDMETPLEKVEKLLLEGWKIPKPRFIVSIIGGTKYFKLSDRLETKFINGIVDIARKSDAWLLTNGYKAGIIQLVGQAISKVRLIDPNQRITAIGICKWGCVADRETIVTSRRRNIQQTTTEESSSMKIRRKGEWDLEKNHSHYLMLDDGTVRKYELGDYRTRFAVHMGRLQHDDDVTIPVVTVVVEGGKDTIANVAYDLRENVPVVLINGSGRAANFLSRWLLYTKDHDYGGYETGNVYGIDELEKTTENFVDSKNTPQTNRNSSSSNETAHIRQQNILENMFKKYRERIIEDLANVVPNKDLSNLVKKVMFCLQPAVRSDITVFNLNSDNDLSETIFRSICQSRQKLNQRNEIEQNKDDQLNTERSRASKELEHYKKRSNTRVRGKGQKAERFRLLKLAMDWDCIDVAREFLFKNSLDNLMKVEQLFITALQQNRPMFVGEFLKLKIDLCKVFLPDDSSISTFRYKKFIRTLYDPDTFNNETKLHLKNVAKEDKEIQVEGVEALNGIIAQLIGDFMHELYYDNSEKEEEDHHRKGLKKKSDKPASDATKREIMSTYFLRDLFLWAVLLNYPDMAKVFLSFMDYRICPALIATQIFRQYHQKASYGDLKKGYEISMEYFEQYAINCLGECYDHDVDKACEILLQRNELYGYVNCLLVADAAQAKKFLATPCCVQTINSIWYDKLHPKQSDSYQQVWMILGFFTLGLTAPVSVNYRVVDEKTTQIDRSKRTLKSNGINYNELATHEYTVRPSYESVITRYFIKLNKFHQSIPMKFFYHIVTYLFFLLLFSYVLLFDFRPPTSQIPSIHWTEILTIILVTCMLIEEIHYFFRQVNLTMWGRTVNYFSKLFKSMTFLGFVLFYIGLIVRFRNANSELDFVAARIIMAIDIEIWWLRLLSFIIVIPLIGPHLVSIGKMLKDLLFFMCIIAIVMIGYGVASRSMTYYPAGHDVVIRGDYPVNSSFDGQSVFRQIIYPVYYLMYGEFGVELTNLDNNRDAGWSIATYILLAIHMMLVNILLINLLIALFSKRFEQVYDKTQEIWYSQTYAVTREYYMRAPFFPPISLVYDIYFLGRMLVSSIQRSCYKKAADYKAKVFQIIPREEFSQKIMKDWREFEEKSTYEYAHNEMKNLRTTSSKSTSRTDTKTNKSHLAMTYIKENNNTTFNGLKEVEDELSNLNSIVNKLNDLEFILKPN